MIGGDTRIGDPGFQARKPKGELVVTQTLLVLQFLLLLPSLATAGFVSTEDLGPGMWGSNTVNQPMDGGGRTIDLYDASLFSGLSGTIEITALGFRAETSGLNYSADDFELRLSTTPTSGNINGGQSFASWHGADVTLVRDGAFSVTTDNSGFFMITLDTTFLWDTTQTLVMEINADGTSGSDNVLLNSFLPSHGLPDRRGYNGLYNATNITFGTNDLTTMQIEYADAVASEVPTPAPVALLTLGMLMLPRRFKRG
ncbi:MAG: hypothetical protein KDI42_01630 [Gammaproteobacteria bacterium]|nr:hypothetical protein [Gammaproteobacteria bacterium]